MERSAHNKTFNISWSKPGDEALWNLRTGDEKNDPIPLLIHGFLENKNMWEGLLADHQVGLLLELPGHGGAPSFWGEAKMSSMAESAWDELLVDFDEEQKFVLCGHSMGGYFALAMAKIHPEKVAEIILWQSTYKADSEEKKVQRDRAIEAVEHNKGRYVSGMIKALFSEENQVRCAVDIAKAVEEAKQMKYQDIQFSLLAMKNREDSSAFLKSSGIKCSLIHGELDPLFPLERQKEEAAWIAAERLVSVASCGHMMHIENPESARSILASLLPSSINKK